MIIVTLRTSVRIRTTWVEMHVKPFWGSGILFLVGGAVMEPRTYRFTIPPPYEMRCCDCDIPHFLRRTEQYRSSNTNEVRSAEYMGEISESSLTTLQPIAHLRSGAVRGGWANKRPQWPQRSQTWFHFTSTVFCNQHSDCGHLGIILKLIFLSTFFHHP